MPTTTALPMVLMFLKATCLLLLALCATLAMARASAGSRHLVWLTALGALLILPVLAYWSPLQVPILPQGWTQRAEADASSVTQRTFSPAANAQAPSAAATPAAASPTDAAAIPSTSAPASSTPLSIGTILLLTWAVVAAGLFAWLAYGALSVRRIVRRSQPLDESRWQVPLYEIADRLGIETIPQLVRSSDVMMPFAAGVTRTTIVLPAASDEWNAERRSAVLIHELGHVRRHDLVGHTLGRIACALYWFHPLVWTAARHLRAESERACDDLALEFGTRPSEYAEHLLDIVTCVRDHRTPAIALAMAHRKEFEGRMLAILNPELQRKGMGRMQSVAMVGSLGLLAVVVGAAAPSSVRHQAPATPGIETGAVAPGMSPRTDRPTSIGLVGVDSDVAGGSKASNRELKHETPNEKKDVRSAMTVQVQHNEVKREAKTESKNEVKHEDAAALTVALSVVAKAGVTADQTPDERAAVLAKTLRTDSSAAIRRIAAWGLQNYAETEVASNTLVFALGSDSDAQVREMSAWALADAKATPAVIAALGKAAQTDKDPKVREKAVWAMGSIGDDAAVPALIAALSSPDAEVRSTAAWAIGSCGPKEAPPALIKLLSDIDPNVRKTAAWALYNIEDPAALPALEAAFNKETDQEIRRDLIRAIGASANDDAAVAVLQRLVTSPDPELRKAAVTALAGGHGGGGPWPEPRPQPRPFP